MPNKSLSPELLTFILQHVQSVEQLEILCLLAEGGTRAWTPSEVFRIVQSSENSVVACLERFRKKELLVSRAPGSYELASANPDLVKTIQALTNAYRERRVTVIEAIYQKPPDTLQDFADAFKLRKDK